eukprot:282352-Rhodomonas_salina.1
MIPFASGTDHCEAIADDFTAPHAALFFNLPTETTQQMRRRRTAEWINSGLDPPIPKRATDVPLQSRSDDIMTALSLHDALDCPAVSKNSILLASVGLDQELEWAWKKLGLNFSQPEEGDSPPSSDSWGLDWETRKKTDSQLWRSALSHDRELLELAEVMEDPDWLEMKATHSRNHDCR